MHYASQAYAKAAKETLPPRELEAALLLKAAAKLQAVNEAWRERPANLNEALLYNRRLWTVFLDSALSDEGRLPAKLRENLIRLGAFVLGETFSLMTNPKREHLVSLIDLNRGIAAGLSPKAR